MIMYHSAIIVMTEFLDRNHFDVVIYRLSVIISIVVSELHFSYFCQIYQDVSLSQK